MNEDEVRALLQHAHADDHAPSLASTLARTRARRSVLAIPAAAFAVAAAALFFAVRSPRAGPDDVVDGGPRVAAVTWDAPELRVTSLVVPTDSLLSIPGDAFLSSTPHMHIPTGGTTP